MKDVKRIIINKNRGWRGLAEARLDDCTGTNITKMIFSFSQDMWDDMQRGYMVFEDTDNYYIINFGNTDSLPKGQRSVLIKYFMAEVFSVHEVNKKDFGDMTLDERLALTHFMKNTNNHTQSDWNCIGIRVIPMI